VVQWFSEEPAKQDAGFPIVPNNSSKEIEAINTSTGTVHTAVSTNLLITQIITHNVHCCCWQINQQQCCCHPAHY